MRDQEILENRLESLEQRGVRRTLQQRRGIDFSSNDYLGFSDDLLLKERIQSRLRDFSSGSTGSRLLRGNTEWFEKIEERLAHFVSRKSALIFPSGYQANLGLFSSLLRKEDVVFSDELNHASIIDGIRLSQAKKVIFKHNDVNALESLLKKNKTNHGLNLIATESLFSMEGTLAPLREIASLSQTHGVYLVVDESHATGLYGKGGGRVQELGIEDSVLASVHTGGKALGVGGAWIAGTPLLQEYLVNFARSFVYSTAPIPAVPVSLDSAIERWKEVGESRALQLKKEAQAFRGVLGQRFTIPCSKNDSPIVPILLGDSQKAVRFARLLQEQGFDLRAIRPPTVPEGRARLRVTLSYPRLGEDLKILTEKLLKVHEEIE